GDARVRLVLPAGLYAGLLFVMLSPSWNWEAHFGFPLRPLAAFIDATAPPGTPVFLAYEYERQALNFYARRRVRWFNPAKPDAVPAGAIVFVPLESTVLGDAEELARNSEWRAVRVR